jgi:ankyrin repeat protein
MTPAVLYLIGQGVDVNGRGGDDLTTIPLCPAIGNNHDSIVHILLDNGALINITDSSSYGTTLNTAFNTGNLQLAQQLIDWGADINTCSGDWNNILTSASARGNLLRVQKVLASGAEINAQGGYYANALMTAIVGRHEAIVRLLLDRGAHIDAQAQNGNALFVASAVGNAKIVRMLLDEGADVNARNMNRRIEDLSVTSQDDRLNDEDAQGLAMPKSYTTSRMTITLTTMKRRTSSTSKVLVLGRATTTFKTTLRRNSMRTTLPAPHQSAKFGRGQVRIRRVCTSAGK